jgi:hypothetical protein
LSVIEPSDGLEDFLDEIEVESIGWLPLEPGAYLHVSDPDATEIVIVGVPQAGAAVLLLV